MGPVGGTECVVDVAVGIGCEFLDELLLAFLDSLLGSSLLFVSGVLGESPGLAFLLCVETEVLKHQDLSGLECRSLCIGLLAVVRKLYRNSEALRDMGDDVLEGELFGNTLRAAEM